MTGVQTCALPICLREAAGAVLMLGCDIRDVRRLFGLLGRLGLLLPHLHWVLGDGQRVEELRAEGLPVGLLAHGGMGPPSLEHYVQDGLELVARAVGAAALTDPALALIPGTTNCMAMQQHGNLSSGVYLARCVVMSWWSRWERERGRGRRGEEVNEVNRGERCAQGRENSNYCILIML